MRTLKGNVGFNGHSNKMKYLVVGTGRSGTGYISELCKGKGLAFGHEMTFNESKLKTKGSADAYIPHIHGCYGDSNWLSVPFLNIYKKANVKIFNVVRDPFKVVKSLIGIGMPGDGVQLNFFNRHIWKFLPGLKAYQKCSRLDLAVYYLVNWNQMIKDFMGDDYKFYRIEEDLGLLMKDMGLPPEIPTKSQLSTTWNTRPGTRYPVPDFNLKSINTLLHRDLRQPFLDYVEEHKYYNIKYNGDVNL